MFRFGVGRTIAGIALTEDVWGKYHPRNFVRREGGGRIELY
jgi:hypothetical protein